MLPSPTEIQYFSEVAKTANLSRAAERLGVTQPTLSLAMKRLEDTMGIPLFIRSKTGVQLTRAGEKLLTQSRRLLDDWQNIKRSTQAEEKELVGQYVLGCHPSVGIYALPQFMPKIMKDHPKLELQVKHGLSRAITEAVVSFKIDFGLVVNPVEHPDLVIKKLCSDQVGFWTKTKPSPLQKSDGSGVLICDPDLAQSQNLIKKMNQKKIKFKRVVTISNLEVIRSLVESGGGIGLLPGRVAIRSHQKPLTQVDNKWPTYEDTHCLIYRKDLHHSEASKTIIQTIFSSLKETN